MRDFDVTPEPSGSERSSSGGESFVVQKHAASHLHYDFRLEHDGVLKSWAVAKGPSVDPAVKRLAIQTEDHPLAYGGFEGTIPKGQYGGGTVMLWDQGTWHPTEDPDKGFKSGRLKFRLDGAKMKGLWALVRMKPRPGDRNPNWLLIKDKDKDAAPGDPDKLLKQDKSVTTKRSMEAIAGNDSAVWQSNRSAEENVKAGALGKPKSKPKKKTAVPKSKNAGSKKKSAKPPPPFIEPQLATRVDEPPGGDDWLHEIKFDGYRLHIRIVDGKVKVLTRHGKDWTDRFAELADAFEDIVADSAYIDGEAVMMDAQGLTDFGALQNWFKAPNGRSVIFYAFDLLYLNGENLRDRPLTERKDALRALLDETPLDNVRYSDHQIGKGDAFFKSAAALGVEGIVSKRADAAYESGRTGGWLKIKRIERQEFVIGGYTLSTNSNVHIGALHLGEYHGDKLVYVGKVGTGFSNAMAHSLFEKLSGLAVKEPPFAEVPREVRRTAFWSKPQLIAEVEFGAWTSDHILRHSAFMGLREDKSPKEIKAERIVPVEEVEDTVAPKKSTRRKAAPLDGDNVVMGVTISHPDRLIFRKEKISKLDVAQYYESVGEVMLPHVADRPLALVRCPDGAGSACFFQKHAGFGMPDSIREEKIGNGKADRVLLIDSVEGLVALVQRGVLEVHTWGSHIKTVEQPDLVVFDIDPDPDLPWKKVVAAATDLRDMLDEVGLATFVKTTGGKGLHVVLPVKPHLEWDGIKQFSRTVADRFAVTAPELYLTNMSIKKRTGRMFIDYLRNGRGATFIAPYSTRAREGAQIATPLSWKELEAGATPKDFTMDRVIERVTGRFMDPWADITKTKQSLTVKMIEKLSEG